MLSENSENKELRVGGKSSGGVIIGAVLVVLGVVVFTFGARPVAEEVNQIQADISSKEVSIVELTDKIQKYTDAEESLQISTEVQRQQSLSAIPIGMQQDEVIENIINITREHDIELKSLSFGKGSAEAEGIHTLRVNSSFEGNYADLISFLEALETNERLVKVDSINVQINKVTISDLTRAIFSLSMEVYYQNES